MSDNKQVDVLADLRGVVRIAKAASVGVTGNEPRIERAERAIEVVAELIEAAHRAEVSFNTVGGCYQRNPGNFMVAMRELEQDVIPLRTALTAIAPAKGDAP